MNWLKLLGLPVLAVGLATALPKLAQAQITVGGEGTIVTPNGSAIDITGGTQAGNNLFHSFSQFNVDGGQTANFVDPGVQNILGRVTGGNASLINGALQVTGGNANLYLMNPAGIIFGSGASLDLSGSFTATTANGIGFGGNWFNAIGSNNYTNLINNPTSFAFTMAQPGAIANAGNLGVGQGQSITLLGGTVINTGTLTAPEGKITVAAVPGEKLVSLSQDGSLLSLALPVGTSTAVNALPFTPLSLPQLLAGGNLSNATGVTVEGDVVRLTGSGVAVPTEAGTAIVANAVNVSGETGGTVHVLGDKVGLVNANVDASGTNGGGTVLVGGDYQGQGTVPNAQQTYVSPDSVIHVDALHSGDGGRAIAWADDTTRFYGNINARGGLQAGNGGFIEVSGKQHLIFRGVADVGAPSGIAGTVLLDPNTIYIVSGNGGANDAALGDRTISLNETDADGIFTISETTLEGLTGNILLVANDLISLENLADNNLTLSSGSSISFRTGTDGTTGSFQMVDPNDTIQTQTGSISIASRSIKIGNLSTNGGDVILAVPNNGEISLEGNSTITTGAERDGNIEITGVIDGSSATPRSLTLLAGAGNVSINGAIGRNASVGSRSISQITITGNDILLDNRFSTQRFSADGSITAQAQGDLTVGFGSTFLAGTDLNLSAQDRVTLTGSNLTAGQAINVQTLGELSSDSTLLTSGTNLTVQANSLAPSSSFQSLTLNAGQNLNVRTQGDLDSRPLSLSAGGNTTLRSLGGSVTLQDTVLEPSSIQGDLTLQAATDIKIQNAEVRSLGNLALLAPGTVTVQDGSKPAIVESGSNLTIQGNSGITLEGFRHPNSRIESGGNLALISDGAIVANIPLVSGGTFATQRIGGGAANFQQTVPSFNTLISSVGDVSFGNYEGPSLKIETQGSITGGNITILGSNSALSGSDPDISLLNSRSTLILQAGVDALQNAPNLPPDRSVGGTSVFSASNSSSPATITIGDIDASIGQVPGPVRLSAPGAIETGTIKTGRVSEAGGTSPITISSGSSVQTGDILAGASDVTITAGGEIKTEDIDTSGFGNISSVKLQAGGDIEISTIDTGAGGIDITAGGAFRATGSFDNFFSGGEGLINDPGLINYLTSLGFSREELLNAKVRISAADAKLSLISRPSDVPDGQLKSPIVIRYGDQKQTIADRSYAIDNVPSRLLILGDSNQTFRMGPVFNDNLVFVPRSEGDRIENYNPSTNNFEFTLNGSRALVDGTAEFPTEASGLAAGIAVGEGTDSSLYGSFQGYAFTPIRPDNPPGGDPGNPSGGDPGSTPGSDPGSPSGGDPGSTPGGDPGSPSGGDPGSTPGGDPGSPSGGDPGSPSGGGGNPQEVSSSNSICAPSSTIASTSGVFSGSDRSSRANSSVNVSSSSCNTLEGSSTGTSGSTTDDTQILKLLDGGVR